VPSQTSPARAEYFPVAVGPRTSSAQWDLRFARATGRVLLAPEWSGVVTDSFLSPGAVVRSGQIIAAVDRASVVALHTRRPLYRPLGMGTSGADVGELNEALRVPGDVYSEATATGLRRLLASSRLADDAVLVRVVWLPSPVVTMAEASLTVGRRAPVAGTVIGTSAPALVSADLVSGTDLPSGATASLIGASPTLQVTPGRQGPELYPALERALRTAGLGSAEETGTRPIRVAVTYPTELLTAPASAILPGRVPGKLCVLKMRGSSAAIVFVTLVDGQPGIATFFGAGIGAGDHVVVNPNELPRRPGCG